MADIFCKDWFTFQVEIKEKLLLKLGVPCTRHPKSCQYPLINYLTPQAAMAVASLDCHGPPPQHQQLTPTPSNVQNMQNIETRNIQEELNQEPNSNQMPEDCQNELCCPIDQSEEAMQPPQHCSCEAVEVNFFPFIDEILF